MRGQPFTRMCQQAARLSRPAAADLHAHTTASDGEYTPSQLVAVARNAGLAAVAVTDHDTTAGLAEAVETARQLTARPIEVIAGVELSIEFAGRGYHVLGYFVDPAHPDLSARLAQVQARRRERFFAYVDRLKGNGILLDGAAAERAVAATSSAGRRHLATLLVAEGHAATRNEAFRRLIGPAAVPPTHRIPFADAVQLIATAGGVSSLAHPPAELTRDELASLAGLGLTAVEAVFPAGPVGRRLELRAWAGELGLAVTAGSDCHGPDSSLRQIGSLGVSADELDRLRKAAVGTPARGS